MQSSLNIQDILKTLPHRFPFLLVDRVLEIKTGESIAALKNVSMNEPFFTGHFPSHPVMPGVLIIEALAQTAALLSFSMLEAVPSEERKEVFYLGGVNNVRFKRIVSPGDQLHLEVELDRHKGSYWKFKGIARVDSEIVCTGEIVGHCAASEDEKFDISEGAIV